MLGKVLAKQARAQLNAPLNASRKSGVSVQGFNSSTSALLEYGTDYTRRYVLFDIDVVRLNLVDLLL